MKNKINLSEKAFWELQSGDSIYVNYKPKGSKEKTLFLAEVYSVWRNRLTAKIVESTVNESLWEQKIKSGEYNHYSIKEKGWFVDVQMSDCAFYGKGENDNREHYHWFNVFGYAYKSIGLENDSTVTTHPSFGNIVISKPSSSHPISLFGSNLQHTNTITMIISHAELDRHLNNDWIHAKDRIIEIEMSAVQFADMITSVGNGGGTPCTIRQLENKSYPDPPFESRIDIFQKEFDARMKNITTKISTDVKEAFDLLANKPSLTKTDRKEIANKFSQFLNEISSNLPFVNQQFNESMEKTVGEAKASIEQYFNSKISQLGIDVAKANPELLIPQITDKENE